MCRTCWEGHDNVAIDTPAVRLAANMIDAVDPYGHLHIVVDDWNLEDGDLRFCEREIEKNERRVSAREIAIEREVLAALRALTEDERASALALHEGFWKPPEVEGASTV